ncbi:BMFP domain-containing protein YqiC [Neorhizobium sp. R1-B]|jgi:BMFP domain-containing protein YqiC|nr:BMFP domain-containing protein YqiC [Neorhizobium sp. R1-B]
MKAVVQSTGFPTNRIAAEHGVAAIGGQGESQLAPMLTVDDACKPAVQALLQIKDIAERSAGQTIWEFRTMATGTNRILDDFARLMTDAAGAAQGVRKEVETAFHAQAERFLNNMDVVKREEFEAVREMAARARDENEALRARIEALEAKLSGQ